MNDIAVCGDRQYFPGMVMTCMSIALSSSDPRAITFYLCAPEIPPESLDRLRNALGELGAKSTVVTGEVSRIAEKELNGVTPSYFRKGYHYWKLFFPSVLDVSEFAYVDSDILCLKNLQELSAPHGGSVASGSVDPFLTNLTDDCQWPLMESEKDLPYVNTGLLAINTSAWNEGQVTQETIGLAATDPKKCTYWDQTPLNYIFRHSVEILPNSWNEVAVQPIDPDTFNPSINLHYLASEKPWVTAWDFGMYRLWRGLWFTICDAFDSLRDLQRSIVKYLSTNEAPSYFERYRGFVDVPHEFVLQTYSDICKRWGIKYGS